MESKEIWSRVPDYPNYEVSDSGIVRSVDRIKKTSNGQSRRYLSVELSPFSNQSGHLKVWLINGEGKRFFYIHDLVARLFIGPRPTALLVLHNDGNEKNNRSVNLRYGTAKENSEDCLKHGSRLVLERHPMAKLSENDVSFIKMRLEKGETQKVIASDFGVARTTIQSIANGKSWNKSHTGGPHFYGK